jgi:transcriptional regulator with XRE-family HTH domain
MARNGNGATTDSPPIQETPRDRLAARAPRGASLSAAQREEWGVWLKTILQQKGWRVVLPTGRVQSFYSAFDRAAGLPATSTAQYVRGKVPETDNLIRIARALGISPLAILFRSGRLSLEQLMALLGPRPRILITDDEARAQLDALADAPMPDFYRVQLEHYLLEDLAYSREIREHLTLSVAEFEQVRAYLTEGGKEQTRRDILADTTPLAYSAEQAATARTVANAGFMLAPIPHRPSPEDPDNAALAPVAQPSTHRPAPDDGETD